MTGIRHRAAVPEMRDVRPVAGADLLRGPGPLGRLRRRVPALRAAAAGVQPPACFASMRAAKRGMTLLPLWLSRLARRLALQTPAGRAER